MCREERERERERERECSGKVLLFDVLGKYQDVDANIKCVAQISR